MSFRAVFFDFGGVLTTPVWDSFSAFCTREGIEADAVRKLFKTDPEALKDLRKLEVGEMTEEEFEQVFGKRLGLEDPEDLIASMFEGMKPLEPMIEAVRELRAAGLKTGLISNSWSTSHYDRKLLGELFDVVVISAEVGLHKPKPEIYRLAAERAGVEPEECIFVDDLRENCEGADAVGMTTVHQVEPGDTIARLSHLTGVSLSGAAAKV